MGSFISSESPTESAKAKEIAYAKTGESSEKNRILRTGWLEVGKDVLGKDQRIYYLEWGNPKGIPFIVLHGGPGAAFNETHVALFDPEKHHVLFFDQRGCGGSTPSAEGMTKEQVEKTNTPAHIIEDMEKLRTEIFGSDAKINVAGGSWGSTLALLYAIAHPGKVESMEIWSTFLGEKDEIEEMFTDRTENKKFPHGAAWKRFIELVPENRRRTGRQVLEYYAEMISSPDPELARKYAFEFELYEDTLCAPDDPSTLEAELESNPNLVSWARIEILYHLNGAFIDEGYILANIDKIKGIPCRIVQGKRDWCTPEKHARRLQKKYGGKCAVEVVESGHMRSDREMKKALSRNMSNHRSDKKQTSN